MNNIVIKGRLCDFPELKQTNSGKSVTNFNVAVNRRFQKDTADFFTIVAWEKTADFICKYFGKGQEILIQGEMQSRKWEDKDGNKRVSWELIANNVEFCGSKADNANLGGAGANVNVTASTADYTTIEGDDDLPF